MKASLFAIGCLAVALTHCSGDRDLFVGNDKGGTTGEGGEDTGGSGASGGDANRGGSGGDASGGDANRGGSSGDAAGGSGAESQGGNGAESGTEGGGRGGTDSGGLGGDVGAGGDVNRGGTSGDGAGGIGELGGGGGTAGSGTGGANSGGTAGSGTGGGNRGGTGGSDVNCAELAAEYLQRLAAAQVCVPTAIPTDMTPCSLQMPDDLICGCPTYVNPEHASDVRRMNELIELAKGCSMVCPAIACPAVKRGICSGDTAIVPAHGRCRGAP